MQRVEAADYRDIVQVSDPQLSSSGDRLAFVSTRGADDDRPQLWVVPTGGGEARQVTDVAGGVSDTAWSPDGSRVAFAQRTTPEERERGSTSNWTRAAGRAATRGTSESRRTPGSSTASSTGRGPTTSTAPGRTSTPWTPAAARSSG